MADAVTSRVIFAGIRRYALHMTNVSDGTGEAAVTKVNLSTLTTHNAAPTKFSVDRIEWAIQGFTEVKLLWDHTTDDVIALLGPGFGYFDWSVGGGIHDPQSAGGTGNVLLTTIGAAAGATYDITLWGRPKV